ncbi:MAG: hypothetical protein FWF45_04515 [Coriobacteriia bacterium]|nr:hypothetical protein [Coriobacteriia bacterium]
MKKISAKKYLAKRILSIVVALCILLSLGLVASHWDAGAEPVTTPQTIGDADTIGSSEATGTTNIKDLLIKDDVGGIDAGQPIGINPASDVIYEATIDLSTTITGGSGYTVTGTAGSYTNPNAAAPTVDRGLTFTAAANGKAYQIIQSGVRNSPSDPTAPKQGTSIYLSITIPDGVDVTLVLNSIDLAGNINLTGSGIATLLTDGTNYVRSRIVVPSTASVTFDSLNGSDTTDRLVITSVANSTSTAASIGAAGGNTSGRITINGGSLDVTTRSGGACIGGGGSTGSGAGNGGITTINGGTVSVMQYGSGDDWGTSPGGACIGGGGGDGSNGGTGGTIRITGGNVVVRQYTRGAGIGGGSFGTAGSITIDNGNVDVQVIRRIDQAGAGEGTGIGAGTGNNGSGTGQITINGGTISSIANYTAIGRVHGNTGPSLSITITGGTIYAKGVNGPGIGFWAASFGDTITITGGTIVAASDTRAGIGGDASTNLRLNAAADVKAYSGETAGSFAAIRTNGNLGDGYFVNARLTSAISATADTRLDVSAKGDSAKLKSLTLPATYPCFAYSTDATTSRTDSIYAFNSASTYIGSIARVADNSPDIYSIIALNGYNAHNSNANNAVLPVKFNPGSMITATYKANGGSGADYVQATGAITGPVTIGIKTLAETGITPPTTGATKFMGWNTAANGTGTSYAAGQANVTIPSSITLYAQWGDRYIVTRDSDNSFIGYYHYLSDAISHCGVYATNGSYTITATEDDPDVNATDHANAVSFPVDKKITLTSASGENFTLMQTQNRRHFDISGELTLKDITLDTVSTGGGGIYLRNRLTMQDGAVLQNCAKSQPIGAAVYIDYYASTPAVFTMSGGSIINNSALGTAGAVYVNGATTFNMTGGTISGNIANTDAGAAGNGGAVYVNGGSFNMSGGTISGNTASLTGTGKGGGVYMNNGTFTLSGTAKITDNTSGVTGNGGGIYLATAGKLVMSGTASVSDNHAPGGYGGGIFTEVYDYSNPIPNVNTAYANIGIAPTASVSGNDCVINHIPPRNAAAFTARALNLFDGTLLNNGDINYVPEFDYTTLSISKMVAGRYGNRTQPFIFTITFKDSGGNLLTGSFSCSGTAISTLDLIGGSTTFTLKHGQTLTIEDVPDNYSVQIVEMPAPGYTTYLDGSSTPNNDTGMQLMSTNYTVAFTNVRDDVPETDIDLGGSRRGSPPFLITSIVVELALAYVLVQTLRRINRKGA